MGLLRCSVNRQSSNVFFWILVQYYTSMPNVCKLIKLSKNPQNEDIPKVIPNGLALKTENEMNFKNEFAKNFKG